MLIKSALMFALVLAFAAPRAIADDRPRYIKTPTGFLMVLRRGDNVVAAIEDLAKRETIPSAGLAGIGFLREVTFGFYNFEKKAFEPRTFRDVELAGMTGSIAWKDGAPSSHMHGTVAGADFVAHGGHILAAEVGTGSVEITVTVHERELQRAVDPEIGANVLQLGAP